MDITERGWHRLSGRVGTPNATDWLGTMAEHEDNELEIRDERKSLVSRPQVLGIIPTWWFWSDEQNWRLVRVPASALAAVAIFIVSLAGLSPIAAGLAAFVAFILGIGTLERYIRRQTKSMQQLEDPELV